MFALADLFYFDSWLANCVAFNLIALPLLYWYSTRNFNYWKKKGINGPTPYPFIGSFLNPFKPVASFHKECMEKYGKAYGSFQGQKPVLFITDPKIIKRVLVQDFSLFRNRMSSNGVNTIMSKNLVNARNEEWKRIRSILSPMFTTSKLRKMETKIGQCAYSLMIALDKIADNSGTFKVHDYMGNFTMDVIAKCAFATDTNAHDEKNNLFIKNARSVFNFNLARQFLLIVIPKFIAKLLNKMKVPKIHSNEIDFFINTSKHLINERRTNKNYSYDDMLQLMVKAEFNEKQTIEKEDLFDNRHVNLGAEEIENEQKILSQIIGSKYLSEDEIIAQSVVFLLAGYETTASTLTYCLYELSMNEDIQERLYEEISEAHQVDPNLGHNTVMKLKYLDAVLSETLRKYSPALILNRECSEDYYIEELNLTMEKNTSISIPVYPIHHSEEYYKDPEKFDPERFMPENLDKIIPYTYLPFGGGPRNCIGMRFALSEAKLGLSQMVMRFKFFKTNKTSDNLKFKKGLFLLKTEPIYVGVKKRH